MQIKGDFKNLTPSGENVCHGFLGNMLMSYTFMYNTIFISLIQSQLSFPVATFG